MFIPTKAKNGSNSCVGGQAIAVARSQRVIADSFLVYKYLPVPLLPDTFKTRPIR
jgi:hypothetical protein